MLSVGGAQLRPFAELLRKLDNRGIIPATISNMEDGTILVRRIIAEMRVQKKSTYWQSLN